MNASFTVHGADGTAILAAAQHQAAALYGTLPWKITRIDASPIVRCGDGAVILWVASVRSTSATEPATTPPGPPSPTPSPPPSATTSTPPTPERATAPPQGRDGARSPASDQHARGNPMSNDHAGVFSARGDSPDEALNRLDRTVGNDPARRRTIGNRRVYELDGGLWEAQITITA